MKKKVAVIGTNGLPARYGGFETLTHYLVENLSGEFDLTVYCSRTSPGQRLNEFNGAKLKYLPFSANGIESIIYDMVSIFHAWLNYDVLLVLGSSGGLILPFNKIFRKKVVLNFGGLDWKRDKWNFFAKKFLKFSEATAVKSSDAIIVDNVVFQDYVRKEYAKDSVVIEYGGDHVIHEENQDVLQKYGLRGKEYFLSVSRAQEDNNIHVLLSAFKDLKNKQLVVISNWNSSEYGKKLKAKYESIDNINLIDAVYDQKELDSIRCAAYCYLHTHSACGSAPSLIEAMNLNLPIISYDVPANRATTENKALFFKDEEELKEIINNLNSSKLEQLKQDSTRISEQRYKWSVISNKYKIILNEN